MHHGERDSVLTSLPQSPVHLEVEALLAVVLLQAEIAAVRLEKGEFPLLRSGFVNVIAAVWSHVPRAEIVLLKLNLVNYIISGEPLMVSTSLKEVLKVGRHATHVLIIN